MNFQENIKNHLSEYKIHKLGVSENGFWKKNKVPYSHILPVEYMDLNLIEDYRKELLQYIQEQKLHLHQDFHHLNSSQAVCLNFFYPLILENKIELLLKILNLENESPELCEFEKIMNFEEGTNFDFYIKLRSGKQIFFEIKYTESKFGKVKSSEKYIKKYNEVYKYRLFEKLKSDLNQYEELIRNYQLLRNLSYLEESNDNLLIIICPNNNYSLYKEYQHVFNNVIVPSLHHNISFIPWESLLDQLTILLHNTSDSPKRLKNHYSNFKEKYLIRGNLDEKK
ncbi:PGN_0703 family putative restriction endonuclease [Peribacillus acanthi]|uniref:PGN_0703 family putative restriction endonuclease n=1 Tax=Peribacillus acanthi TaxID=2171554 RepID=UPI000D3E4B98|nr:hypothetical protein [Peribacillus acanthi]